jgi:uncharacterized protein (TIGR00369 family)
MPAFEPKNPDYANAVAAVFAAQPAMHTLGIALARLEPGECDLVLPFAATVAQQNGFVHAGIVTTALDSACGMAAFSLMPAGANVLTVEFKVNLLAPAVGERFACRARVVKPGRTITFCDAQAVALGAGGETLVATMTATMMALPARNRGG